MTSALRILSYRREGRTNERTKQSIDDASRLINVVIILQDNVKDRVRDLKKIYAMLNLPKVIINIKQSSP